MNIYKRQYTIDELKKGKSIVRYGDGELVVMVGIDISFQKSSPKLQERLKEVLTTDNENVCVGVYVPDKPKYVNIFNATLGDKANNFYHDALLSRTKKDLHILKQLIALWADKDVTVVHYNLDNWIPLLRMAKSVKHIYCKSVNAFDDYDVILKNCLKDATENSIFLLSCGPCATILAYDLAVNGYQALDLGRFYAKFSSPVFADSMFQ